MSNTTCFNTLPAELRNDIYAKVALHDQILVTDKTIRGRCYITRYSPGIIAIGSFASFHEYRSYIFSELVKGSREKIRVRVTDYQFNNFKKFLEELEKEERALETTSLQRFHCQQGADPAVMPELYGPFFSVKLTFSSGFTLDQSKLQQWIRKGVQIANTRGHLRVKYEVRVEDPYDVGVREYQAGIDYAEPATGQWQFIRGGLQEYFNTPHPTHWASTGYGGTGICLWDPMGVGDAEIAAYKEEQEELKDYMKMYELFEQERDVEAIVRVKIEQGIEPPVVTAMKRREIPWRPCMWRMGFDEDFMRKWGAGDVVDEALRAAREQAQGEDDVEMEE